MLPSLFPIHVDSIREHLVALGYKNVPDEILKEFVQDLQKLEHDLETLEQESENDRMEDNNPFQELPRQFELMNVQRQRPQSSIPVKKADTYHLRPKTSVSQRVSDRPTWNDSTIIDKRHPPNSQAISNRELDSRPRQFKKHEKNRQIDPVSLYYQHQKEWKFQPNLKIRKQ